MERKVVYNPKRRTTAIFEDGFLKIGYTGPIAERKFLENLCTGAEICITDQNFVIPARKDERIASFYEWVKQGLIELPAHPQFFRCVIKVQEP